jgi:hypothetical protein
MKPHERRDPSSTNDAKRFGRHPGTMIAAKIFAIFGTLSCDNSPARAIRDRV